jgi:hypothetical protein
MDGNTIANRLRARAADLDTGSRRLVGLQVLTRQVANELRDLAQALEQGTAEQPTKEDH